jgi:hypothetical protein
MKEDFFETAVIELAAALATQPGAWKAQMDKAIEMAEYLTKQMNTDISLDTYNTLEQ